MKDVGNGISNWLGGVTKIAKSGFEIYNKIKSLIPGGTKAGAGPVPGSADIGDEELELYEMIGFAEIEGIGKKITDAMGIEVANKEEAYKRRLAIW